MDSVVSFVPLKQLTNSDGYFSLLCKFLSTFKLSNA